MLNRVNIMGRITRDPELRRTQTGTPVTSFTIACDRDFGGDDKVTDFIDCTAWKSTAEFVQRYFTKGRMAIVSGRLQMRDWTDKDGNKRRNAEVLAESVYFGDSKREQSDRDNHTEYKGSYTAPVTTSDFVEMDDDGELPFN